MKKSSILNFFASQSQVNTTSCPACGALVQKSKLNEHLDSSCSSAPPVTNGRDESRQCSSRSKPACSTNAARSNRLCLKAQRKEQIKKTLTCFSNFKSTEVTEDDEVVILKEIKSPKKTTAASNAASTSSVDESSKLKTLTVEHSTTNSSTISKLSRRRNLKRHILITDNHDSNAVSSAKSSVLMESISSKDVSHSKRRKSSAKKFIPSNKSVSSTYNNALHSSINRTISCDLATIPKSETDVIKSTSQDVNKSNESVSSTYKNALHSSINRTIFFDLAKTSKSETDVTKSTSQDVNKSTAICLDEIQDCSVFQSRAETSSQAIATEIVSCNAAEKVSGSASPLDKMQVLEDSFQPNTAIARDSSKRSTILSPTSEIANILQDAKVVMECDSLFSELSDGNHEEVQSSQNLKPYAPYYIANFKHILDTVLSDEDNQKLFNDEDGDSIAAFKGQKDASQKLYVRLFQRKYKWLRVNKINYPEITNNPQQTLEELVNAGLVDSGTSDIELETALDLLSLPETKSLAKHFNFISGKNKSEIKQMFLKHCKEHKSVFFMTGNNGIANKVLKKVKQILGPCYRISLLPKRLFTRVLMLFSLPTISEDDDEAAGGQQQQLLTLLQVNKGELVFPDYKQTKSTVIFQDRDELIRYEEARQLENDIFNAVENKNFNLAKDLYINAKEEFEEQCSCSFSDRSSSLPVFLKRYTSFHVYIRCMTQGVEVLQKLRQYKEAVALLKRLLKQKVYCQDYSGRWYDRLALNLEQHLKQPEQALGAIKKGLQNANVRVGHRYALLTRALRITKSWDENDEFRNQILKEVSVKDAPKVIIKGRLCPRSILGRRHVFISSSGVASDDDAVTVLGVEQLAIEHYQGEGFPEGVHGEGSTFISLYSLLFWDIIYDGSIPDVFISPYQTHPLDLNSEVFFLNREHQILNHLDTLRSSTIEELKEIVKSTWENHHGQTSLVSWDRFRDVEHVQGLVGCLGNHVLCGICERLARDFRFTRSGVPDLVVWNPDTQCVKIVEVKGPGDKLSSKQILWLDYLLTLGADAEVCLVEAVASKKLRKLES